MVDSNDSFVTVNYLCSSLVKHNHLSKRSDSDHSVAIIIGKLYSFFNDNAY